MGSDAVLEPGCDLWIVPNILDLRGQFDRGICAKHGGIQGFRPITPMGIRVAKWGRRIMQFSQSHHHNAVSLRFRGSGFPRNARFWSTAIYKYYPIEERISKHEKQHTLYGPVAVRTVRVAQRVCTVVNDRFD